MICPRCSFVLSTADKDCPRCHEEGLAPELTSFAPEVFSASTGTPEVQTSNASWAQPTVPLSHPSTSGDKPSFLMALLGFCIPLVGLIIYLADRAARPLHARSAGRGAALGFGLTLVALPLIFVLAILAPVFTRARGNAQRVSCQQNLQQLSLAAVEYAEAHNGKYPNLSTPASVRAALGSYVKNPEIFSCSPSHLPYQANASLSGKNYSQELDKASTLLFYEAADAHFEGHNAAFMDGHVKWFSDSNPPAASVPVGGSEAVYVDSRIDLVYKEVQAQGRALVQ